MTYSTQKPMLINVDSGKAIQVSAALSFAQRRQKSTLVRDLTLPVSFYHYFQLELHQLSRLLYVNVLQ